jgi:hypothetical protein
LAWQSGGSNLTTFSAALTGTGTLYQGFDEVVPWPDSTLYGPPGYPLAPRQLTPGDWMQDMHGVVYDSRVLAALDNHIIHRTVLALPIYDRLIGNGADAYVHFMRMGSFLLRGYSVGSQTFLDLVYLGSTTLLNCTTAATATPIVSGTITPSFATVTMTPSPTVTPSATTTPSPTITATPTSTPQAMRLTITNSL